MAKQKDVTYIREDGVKVTVCAPKFSKKELREMELTKHKTKREKKDTEQLHND